MVITDQRWFSSQKASNAEIDLFFVVILNKVFNKQTKSTWMETSLRPWFRGNKYGLIFVHDIAPLGRLPLFRNSG